MESPYSDHGKDQTMDKEEVAEKLQATSTKENGEEEEVDDKQIESWRGSWLKKQLQPPLVDRIAHGQEAYRFYREVLGSPRLVVAPMVDMSELPFRMLCRRYKAELCYTPMLHSKNFSIDAKYRKKEFSTCPQDRPLVVQFCGNDPEILLRAAKFVEKDCDAVDINLGCPQNIAKRGYYGSFLLENWPLIQAMVSTLYKNLSIPVFCKIRLLPSIEDTITLAQIIQDAGCKLLCVHGRTKENKGRNATPADWHAIRRIKEALTIPVLANGSIESLADVDQCLAISGADGVMAATATLHYPTVFSGEIVDGCEVSLQYLDLCSQYPTSLKIMKSHICKTLKKQLATYQDLREKLMSKEVRNLPEIRNLVLEVHDRIKRGAAAVVLEEERPAVEVRLQQQVPHEEFFSADIFISPNDDEEEEEAQQE
jgi:tRNA-dihydrouridine synthase 1